MNSSISFVAIETDSSKLVSFLYLQFWQNSLIRMKKKDFVIFATEKKICDKYEGGKLKPHSQNVVTKFASFHVRKFKFGQSLCK